MWMQTTCMPDLIPSCLRLSYIFPKTLLDSCRTRPSWWSSHMMWIQLSLLSGCQHCAGKWRFLMQSWRASHVLERWFFLLSSYALKDPLIFLENKPYGINIFFWLFYVLNQIVHKKTASVLCLTSVKNEDKLEFSKVLEAVKVIAICAKTTVWLPFMFTIWRLLFIQGISKVFFL